MVLADGMGQADILTDAQLIRWLICQPTVAWISVEYRLNVSWTSVNMPVTLPTLDQHISLNVSTDTQPTLNCYSLNRHSTDAKPTDWINRPCMTSRYLTDVLTECQQPTRKWYSLNQHSTDTHSTNTQLTSWPTDLIYQHVSADTWPIQGGYLLTYWLSVSWIYQLIVLTDTTCSKHNPC